VVPMNALLQHRGHILMGAGHSIAVQNFNENIAILVMTSTYSLLIMFGVHIYWVIGMFGLLVAGIMLLIKRHHEANQRVHDAVSQLEDVRH
ncbi:MAG: lysophospholipid transporter LplT, partial [Rhodocyclaceae bacterium]|nr:lysophospholipid transporter LplT [Rhodocyclaceae bacterium]